MRPTAHLHYAEARHRKGRAALPVILFTLLRSFEEGRRGQANFGFWILDFVLDKRLRTPRGTILGGP